MVGDFLDAKSEIVAIVRFVVEEVESQNSDAKASLGELIKEDDYEVASQVAECDDASEYYIDQVAMSKIQNQVEPLTQTSPMFSFDDPTFF